MTTHREHTDSLGNLTSSGYNMPTTTTISGGTGKVSDSIEMPSSDATFPPITETTRHALTSKQWIQILSTLIAFFNTWGLLLTFGVFQTYYEDVLLKGQSSSKISWISTTCAFFVLSTGLVTGPLFDRGFYRILLVLGSLLEVVGFMVLSLSTEYYQVFLSQAICVGIGGGIVFTPSVAAASACINSPSIRARVMGLIAAGSSIGGIVYPLIFRYLQPHLGFAWTVRIIGFICLALYLIAYLTLADKPKQPPVVRYFVDLSAIKDLPFLVLCFASILSATAYYIPFLYLPLLTQLRIPSATSSFSFDLLSILNGASAIGRILAGLAAAVFGPTETICVCLVFGSILLFSWIAVDTIAGIVVWAVFWGMVSGVLVALPGAIVPLLCPSIATIGTRSGMYWLSVGIGLLIGSPIGGAIYDFKSQKRNWWHLQVFGGVFMLGAALFTLYPLVHLRRHKARSARP
ncbi:putative MFS monocarboxylate transporter [Xylaria arbuscula]|nr:putative MFS monocarboxylate transporter [Xylaria arbuscula]